jgi:hypothetical protein
MLAAVILFASSKKYFLQFRIPVYRGVPNYTLKRRKAEWQNSQKYGTEHGMAHTPSVYIPGSRSEPHSNKIAFSLHPLPLMREETESGSGMQELII